MSAGVRRRITSPPVPLCCGLMEGRGSMRSPTLREDADDGTHQHHV